jgi:hypothetical protein
MSTRMSTLNGKVHLPVAHTESLNLRCSALNGKFFNRLPHWHLMSNLIATAVCAAQYRSVLR